MNEVMNKPTGIVTILSHTGTYDFDTNEVKNGIIIEKREYKNLIVNRSSAILSSAILPKNNMAITHLAVGIGEGDGLMPIEDITKTSLVKEVHRVEIDRYGLIDSNGKIIDINRIDNVSGSILKASIKDIGNYELVEMGLFGGIGAEYEGSGIMFNYKTFSNWVVPEDASLTIVWRLYFGQRNK